MFLGLCLEQLGGVDNNMDLSQALGAYEEATRLSLNFLHLAKSSGLLNHPVAYKAIKVATERGPVLAFRLGEPVRALSLFRRVLQARDEDTLQESRFICATSLASLLAFHSSPNAHLLPKPSLLISAPSHLHEESILVANIAKTYIDSWKVSKTTPVPSPEVIFDLLCLTLTCVGLHQQLVQALEDSMKFAFMVPHIWFQFGLSLVASGKDLQALAVFKECINLSPQDPLILCTAAKFALEKSTKPDLCIEWATRANEVRHFLQPRAQFLMGRGYSVLSERELSTEKRGVLFKKGLEHLKRAAELDPKNIDFAFYLALQYAESRELQKAKEQIQHSLSLNAGHTSCLHLLALIYSAEKQYTEALQICDFALQKHPDNFGILECKIKLEVITVGTNQAFKTCRHALKLWQKVFSEESTGMIGAIMQDGVSLSDLQLTGFQREGPDPFNVATSVTPDFASDVGSSHFSINTTQTTPNQPNLLQARIWCTIGEVFLLAKKTPDAISCIREAQYLAPYLPSVFICYGRTLASEKSYESALEQFRSALVLQPINPTTLTQIGRMLHLLGRSVEAEKYLREATSIDRLHHEAWYWLGQVFSAQGLHELSSDCFKTSLDLERTTPVQPFSAVLSSFLSS